MAFNGFRKGGGGYLNNVSAVISGYKFGSKVWESKKKGGDDYTTLSVQLLIVPDGATAPVQQFLQAGFLQDNQRISANGLTLESEDDSAIILEDSEFGKFILSAFEAGLPEDALREDGRNYEGLIGYRVTFKKVVDEEATAKFGRRVDKKDKTKSYNRDYLTVSAVLGKQAVAAGKSKAAKLSAPISKRNGAVTEADEQASVDVLVALLEATGGTLPMNKLSSLLVKHALSTGMPAAEREAHRKLITSAAFVANERGWFVADGDVVLA